MNAMDLEEMLLFERAAQQAFLADKILTNDGLIARVKRAKNTEIEDLAMEAHKALANLQVKIDHELMSLKVKYTNDPR